MKKIGMLSPRLIKKRINRPDYKPTNLELLRTKAGLVHTPFKQLRELYDDNTCR